MPDNRRQDRAGNIIACGLASACANIGLGNDGFELIDQRTGTLRRQHLGHRMRCRIDP
jgi:hypothetical protein